MIDTAKLSDIHDFTFEQRVIALTERETLELAELSAEFVGRPCPACTNDDRRRYMTIRGLEYVKCAACETIYVDPCPTDQHIGRFLNESQGMRIWREEMPEELKASRRRMYLRRLDDALATANAYRIEPRIVVEVGGGSGEFAMEASRAQAFGKLVVAEPQPLELDLPGVEVVSGSFEDIDIGEPADIMVAFEVFEHLIEPDRFLAMARRSLRGGGVLLMTTPNAISLEVAALGEKSNVLPFDHIRLYNPNAMRIVLERNGFEVLCIETPGKLDVQILQQAREGGLIETGPALDFILDDERLSDRLQDFVRENLISSHMRIVART